MEPIRSENGGPGEESRAGTENCSKYGRDGGECVLVAVQSGMHKMSVSKRIRWKISVCNLLKEDYRIDSHPCPRRLRA